MVRIEGGTFIDDEGDEITIKPFYISKNLVTINQWNKHSEDKIDIKKYNAKYNINIKSEKYPAIFETEEKYGMVNIKDSLSLFKFCNSLSKVKTRRVTPLLKTIMVYRPYLSIIMGSACLVNTN